MNPAKWRSIVRKLKGKKSYNISDDNKVCEFVDKDGVIVQVKTK